MEFQKFDKIPRLSRDIVITEKIDGTNGQICILKDCNIPLYFSNPSEFSMFYSQYGLYIYEDVDTTYYLFAGSRKRWLDTSSDGDNFGFAKWVQANAEELLKLGEGRHYGEWYGKGIQRGYGLDERRFYLFNVGKWEKRTDRTLLQLEPVDDKKSFCPSCCDVVPILCQNNIFDTHLINTVLRDLEKHGSYAVPGFMNPEGIIIYHKASGSLFKKTLVGDEKPKTL